MSAHAKCVGNLIAGMADLGAEVWATETPPATMTQWVVVGVCPHGVRVYSAPTAAQLARWEIEGTP